MKIILILIVFVCARREKKKSSTEILYGIYRKMKAHKFQGKPFTCNINYYIVFFGSELLQTDYDKNIRPYYLIKPVDISIDIFMNSFGSGTLTK